MSSYLKQLGIKPAYPTNDVNRKFKEEKEESKTNFSFPFYPHPASLGSHASNISINLNNLNNLQNYSIPISQLHNFTISKSVNCADVFTGPVVQNCDPFSTPMIFKSYTDMVKFITMHYSYEDAYGRYEQFKWEEECNPVKRDNYVWCGASIVLVEKFDTVNNIIVKLGIDGNNKYTTIGMMNQQNTYKSYTNNTYISNSPITLAISSFEDNTGLFFKSKLNLENYLRNNAMVIAKPMINSQKQLTFFITFVLYNNLDQTYIDVALAKVLRFCSRTTEGITTYRNTYLYKSNQFLEISNNVAYKNSKDINPRDFEIIKLVCESETNILNHYMTNNDTAVKKEHLFLSENNIKN